MSKTLQIWILALIAITTIQAQNTVGLLSIDENQVSEGYNLMYPHNQSDVYLLNNCGQIVHEWEGSDYLPGNSAHLTEDGKLYKTIGQGTASNSYIHAGGAGEGFEIRDWENNMEWQWFYNDSLHRPHHDFSVLPNGNVLFIAWERITAETAFAAGRDTMLLEDGELWPEQIIEVEPADADTGNIVWEWNAMDHVVQDFDETQQNFGDPAAHPELIDINYGGGADDWLHFNAIDYNETWDQIMISCPRFNEIWIIDHSTTTEQAAGHAGGFGGKGGDLLFRWGNPEAYRAGNIADQKLFFQHDCHWMDIGLTNSDPNYGKIMVFNNRVGDDYSTVNIINPVFDSYYLGFEMSGGAYLPIDFDWTYQRPDSTALHSTGLSSVQRLPNGNTMICVGRYGYSFEINGDEEIVWEYKNPLSGGNPVAQGTTLAQSENLMFRMKRYPSNYQAFDGQEFSSQGYIEINPDTTLCNVVSSIAEYSTNANITLFPNLVNNEFHVIAQEPITSVEMFNAVGLKLMDHSISGSNITINTEHLTNDFYLVKITTISNAVAFEKIMIQR